MTRQQNKFNKATALSPAKINLCLKIVGQKANGYHELQTAFQLINLCDKLTFTVRPDNIIQRTGGLEGLASADDLTVRAAQALLHTYKTQTTRTQTTPVKNHTASYGVDINIEKNIPAGGGLGGGSSNAATALLALNQLWALNFSKDELANIGLSLGADVPVFIHGINAYAEGIGEKMLPLPKKLSQPAYVLITPDCHVDTGSVFNHPQLIRNTPRRKPEEIFDHITLATQADSRTSTNDCETVVTQSFTKIGDALALLRTFGPAQLTGTGATVFLPCQNLASAQEILQKVRRKTPKNWQSWAINQLNRSPSLEFHHE